MSRYPYTQIKKVATRSAGNSIYSLWMISLSFYFNTDELATCPQCTCVNYVTSSLSVPLLSFLSFQRLPEAAQEASKQTQEAIGKAADKAATTIKEMGKKMETKWFVQNEQWSRVILRAQISNSIGIGGDGILGNIYIRILRTHSSISFLFQFFLFFISLP